MSEVEAETAADRTGAARDAQWPRPTVAGPPTNPEAVRTDSINIGKRINSAVAVAVSARRNLIFNHLEVYI